jgi:hypothetical protein
MTVSRDKDTFHELHEGDSANHIILKITVFLFFHIPTLHPLHPKSLIIGVYCGFTTLMISKLNLLLDLATTYSQFKYSHTSYIITGDLKIMGNLR